MQCNGFSAYVNPDDFCGPGFQTGYDPVWVDLLAHHAEKPFHLLVGGGDQLYCDGCANANQLQFSLCKLNVGYSYLFQRCSRTRNARVDNTPKQKRENELSSETGDAGRDRPVLLQPLLRVFSQWSVRPRQLLDVCLSRSASRGFDSEDPLQALC